MANFNDNGRGRGPRRRSDDTRRRAIRLMMESLESRRLLTGTPTGANSNYSDIQHGPLANEGQDLIHIYEQYVNYEQGGANGTFHSTLDQFVNFSNHTSVGIDAHYTGDLTTYENSLKSLGMSVLATNSQAHIVEGYIPIASLPQLAGAAQTVSVSPVYTPTAFSMGIAANQAAQTDFTDAAATKYGVTGKGVPIGVISTSYNHGTPNAQNSSYKTGDLPTNVQVIDDSSKLTDDEGRGMLENIHDIAPDSPLSFATGAAGTTATGGPLQFANNIGALATQAGAKVIVDDLGIANDPYFQDGVISQAINSYVAGGGVYVAAAGNQADSGYLSNFRPVNATVGAIGAGRYMNFDGAGATVSPTLPIFIYAANTGIVMQFDQPFDKPGGGVSTEVDLYLLDKAGNIVGQSNSNNVTFNEPIQAIFTDNNGNALAGGQYQLAAKVVSGPDPGHIVFYATGDSGFSVSRQFGTAGGTSYPSTFGHNAGANTISVGAVPFWGAQPFTSPATVYNEPFSSTGPRLIDISPDGTPIPPQVLLKPDLSAADGGVTSFFPIAPAGTQHADTSKPPFPTSAFPPYPGDPQNVQGEPATATNLNPGTLPDFFGTSSAAPNLAAIIALIKQSSPNITRADLLSVLESTATPLNGGGQSVWTPQGGYGLARADLAIAAAQALSAKVVFISPGGNQTVSTVPTYLQVQFSQPIKLSSVSSANLTVTGPNGATVTVGQPVGVDDPNFPTFVRFPITITPRPGTVANGIYVDKFVPGSIVTQKGGALTGTYVDQFNLQQVQQPRVANVSYVGRIVNIVFSEAINPATVTPDNIYLFRNNGVNNPNFNPNGIKVSQLPGAKLTYNPSTFTATIDLTALAQSSLPTDHYGLVVKNTVTDAVGNPLNGVFNGVFPSGVASPPRRRVDLLPGPGRHHGPAPAGLVPDPGGELGLGHPGRQQHQRQDAQPERAVDRQVPRHTVRGPGVRGVQRDLAPRRPDRRAGSRPRIERPGVRRPLRRADDHRLPRPVHDRLPARRHAPARGLESSPGRGRRPARPAAVPWPVLEPGRGLPDRRVPALRRLAGQRRPGDLDPPGRQHQQPVDVDAQHHRSRQPDGARQPVRRRSQAGDPRARPDHRGERPELQAVPGQWPQPR